MENKSLYLFPFIHWHASSVQSSDPVLYVRDLGIKRKNVTAGFNFFKTNVTCQLSLTWLLLFLYLTLGVLHVGSCLSDLVLKLDQ